MPIIGIMNNYFLIKDKILSLQVEGYGDNQTIVPQSQKGDWATPNFKDGKSDDTFTFG